MGAEESGFLVYFPDFVLSVDTAVDSHLSFDPLGRLAPLSTLHYIQPRSPPATYPYASLPALSTALPSPATAPSKPTAVGLPPTLPLPSVRLTSLCFSLP